MQACKLRLLSLPDGSVYHHKKTGEEPDKKTATFKPTCLPMLMHRSMYATTSHPNHIYDSTSSVTKHENQGITETVQLLRRKVRHDPQVCVLQHHIQTISTMRFLHRARRTLLKERIKDTRKHKQLSCSEEESYITPETSLRNGQRGQCLVKATSTIEVVEACKQIILKKGTTRLPKRRTWLTTQKKLYQC